MPHQQMTDLDARARWHLEIGYPPAAPAAEALPSHEDDDAGGPYTCWGCGGSGVRIFCLDDLCRNSDHCMHGDGDGPCPQCRGEGAL
jgi:hypothetical protein